MSAADSVAPRGDAAAPARMPAHGEPDAAALGAMLASHALPLRVEADGSLAVLVPLAPVRAFDAPLRALLVAAARDAGFTHVALELLPDPTSRPAAGP